MSPAATRRFFLSALGSAGVLTALGSSPAHARQDGHLRAAYLGSFGWTTPPGEGFEVACHDTLSGRLTPRRAVPGVPDASWLAFSPDGQVLYTTNELVPNGSVTALSLVDPHHPRPLNTRSTEGAGPTHLSVHPTGRFLLTANYTDGTVVVHRLRQDGGVGELTDLVQHTSPERPPRAHQVIVDPSGRWVVAVDLGADAVHTYRLDLSSGTLHHNSRLSVASGNGPRHLAFHPSGRHAYLVNELASTVTVLDWHAATGVFTAGATLDTRPEGATGENYPAEVVVDRPGRTCYVTNRGDDTVAVFALSEHGARLRLVDSVPTGGEWPRHCTLDPGQRWMYVANQNSGTVTRLARNTVTGELGALIDSAEVAGAAVLAFQP
ncbi:lactonase family protein [Actinopolyspora mortivallis]|uniref:Lactonase family protein n=1 Tax=Actinopolyspora mortivallis TaxID=33906 RepID=A0A2T0GXZ7_ACTMO|nr:lactonase family protein [Actinopolyspora mortivallis]PRW63974.1 lactonase family protein [Actinopolyspora mortivallis]